MAYMCCVYHWFVLLLLLCSSQPYKSCCIKYIGQEICRELRPWWLLEQGRVASDVSEVVHLSLPTGQWCLAWWCFGGAGQLAAMTWCCRPSSFFFCTASGESRVFPLFLVCFVHVFHIFFASFYPQVGSFVRGSLRPPVRLRAVMFCNAGGPWPRVPGNPGQLPYLWERHHVVKHER